MRAHLGSAAARVRLSAPERAAAECGCRSTRLVLAMTVAVSVGEGNALIIGAAGVPAVLSVSALLAACSMVWQGGEATGRYSLRTCRMPYFLCITLAVLSALLRAAIAALCNV